MTTPVTDPIAVKAVETAQKWQKQANELLTHEEKGIQEQMQRLLTHPMDKVIMTKLIDQSFRSHDPARVADQVNSILTSYGVPDFFSRVEKLLMQMFLDLGRHFPALAVPKMIKRMRRNSSRAIISGDGNFLHAHLAKRRQQGVRMNINHLGEAVLGEEEARGRVETYVADMKNPDIEYISVKISTIYSQISSLAFDHTVGVLKERLSEIYAVGKENFFHGPTAPGCPSSSTSTWKSTGISRSPTPPLPKPWTRRNSRIIRPVSCSRPTCPTPSKSSRN